MPYYKHDTNTTIFNFKELVLNISLISFTIQKFLSDRIHENQNFLYLTSLLGQIKMYTKSLNSFFPVLLIFPCFFGLVPKLIIKCIVLPD